ncbi:FtsX-like permease family protein [Streptomyces sp. HUAS ZL42]|uniref:FtsX-like permease family protein n=1 Tax=Streptomyces sp. HUAS ZL42 TaxID=3231715 RepID=UPI00345EEAA4
MTGSAGLARFVLLRARAHRPLLAAALLTVLLTSAVLATLTAYSGAIGDAALRHSLREPRNAADSALIVKADVPAEGRTAADTTVRNGARATFDGLPVTVRTLLRSGPYALPRSLQPRAERTGEPDLTYLAALDRSQVRITAGRAPEEGSALEAAVPQTAARRLGLKPGTRLTLADRLGGSAVQVRITGVYRPADPAAPYWRLDDLGGRGVKEGAFTTYGPLLATPSVITGGKVSAGPSAWLASADYSTVTTGRIDTLREAARTGSAALRDQPALSGTTASTTSLPDVLDRADRALLVSRSTLLIVALQLTLLAACALLLVARLLSSERVGETRLLRARGASRARIAGLAALEALLLAGPSVICAPLLAGPLTRLLAEQGPLARIGLHLDVPSGGRLGVWLVAAGVALGCASAVTAPELAAALGGARGDGREDPSSDGTRVARPRSLPAPVRAGADLGLLAVAGVAYWQLNRQPSGAVTGDTAGTLGIDPLLVAAPALALLAGTVLTLRLLPPVARLAERRAAGGRGLATALAGWQFSRRPTRGAGPVLLLVLAVALGMLAIGQGASWDRSQADQADFRAGAPVRVLGTGAAGLGRTEEYAAVPRAGAAAPVVRTTLPLSGGRSAAVLAVDTAHAADMLLMRRDLASEPVRPLLAGLSPRGSAAGVNVPAGAARLRLTTTLRSSGTGMTADVTLTLEDRYGIPYQLPAGRLPADGRPHALVVELPGTQGRLTLSSLRLDMSQPAGRAQQHRFTVDGLESVAADGAARRLPLPSSWTATPGIGDGEPALPGGTDIPTPPQLTSSAPPTMEYDTGYVPSEDSWGTSPLTVRLGVTQPAAPEVTGVATERFLTSAGARTGQNVDVTFGGESVPVRIVRTVRELPTTAETDTGGALLVDLRAVNRVLEERYGAGVPPNEWWLRPVPGHAADVAAALRARPDMDPGRVVVRDEIADELRDDPFGAGPEAAFAVAAGVAAALAAVGFAVSAAGSLRERDAEFAILRALGAPRRRLARMIAAEHGVLVLLGLLVGAALGTVLTRAVIPLVVLTAQATRPVPHVLVELPPGQAAVLLAAVAVTPLAVTVVLALRRADPASALRFQGGE